MVLGIVVSKIHIIVTLYHTVLSLSLSLSLSMVLGIVVSKVACHSGGKHCLALTNNGEMYSWGEGDDGKLGHGGTA